MVKNGKMYIKIGVRETTFGGGCPDIIIFSKTGEKINAIFEERDERGDGYLFRPETQNFPWSYIHPDVKVGGDLKKALNAFCGQFERFRDEFREPFTVCETIPTEDISTKESVLIHSGMGWHSKFTHLYEKI